jgi:hypothetical protein
LHFNSQWAKPSRVYGGELLTSKAATPLFELAVNSLKVDSRKFFSVA